MILDKGKAMRKSKIQVGKFYQYEMKNSKSGGVILVKKADLDGFIGPHTYDGKFSGWKEDDEGLVHSSEIIREVAGWDINVLGDPAAPKVFYWSAELRTVDGYGHVCVEATNRKDAETKVQKYLVRFGITGIDLTKLAFSISESLT